MAGVRMYGACAPYNTQQAPDPTKTPVIDGWRSPDQPNQVSCCMPQQFRSWDLENLVWGMQTQIQPLLASIASNINTGANGVITTQNLVPTGVATLNSAVSISTQNKSVLSVQLSGAWTGNLLVYLSNDGINWVQVAATSYYNPNSLQYLNSITVNGIVKVDVAGALYARVSSNSAVTGNIAVSLSVADSSAPNGALAPIVTGTNRIGAIVPAHDATMAQSGSNGIFRLITAATINATIVKNSPAVVSGIEIFNTDNVDIYVKLYNKSTLPAPATDSALLVKTILVMAKTSVIINSAVGIKFAVGIGIAVVLNIADNDATAIVTANKSVTNISYT